MDALIGSLTRVVEAAVVASVLGAAVRAVDRLDPVGAEAREALSDDALARFVGPGVTS